MENKFSCNDNDNSIMLIIKQNNQDSFSVFYDKYAPLLLGLIKRMVINDSVSEVVFQKVFVEIWRRKESCDISKERLFTWMHKIARSITIDFIRSGEIACNSAEELLHSSMYSEKVEQFLMEKDNGSGHICSIAKHDKEIISLIYYKGLTIPEVATELGIPLEELCGKLRIVLESLK